jgi:hypothetical protein
LDYTIAKPVTESSFILAWRQFRLLEDRASWHFLTPTSFSQEDVKNKAQSILDRLIGISNIPSQKTTQHVRPCSLQKCTMDGRQQNT